MIQKAQPQEHQPGLLRREQWAVGLFLLFTMLTLSHFVHEHWFAMDAAPALVSPSSGPAALSSSPSPIANGRISLGTGTVSAEAAQPADYAPNVYRIGAAFVARVLGRLLPVHWSSVLALMDFVFGSVALFVLYRVLVEDMPTTGTERTHRATLVLGFLASIAFPLSWVVPWQRPETMIATCFLALATLCLNRLHLGATWFAALLFLALGQALTRSDVPAAFGAAVLLLGIFGSTSKLRSKRRTLIAGAAVVLVAGATQAYLQLVAFPHRPYPPGTPLLQFPYNFSTHNLNQFTLATLPAVTVLFTGWRRGQPWRNTDLLAMSAAAVYLPVWYLFGSTAEVRIFVPFLFLLCLPSARVLAGLLTD